MRPSLTPTHPTYNRTIGGGSTARAKHEARGKLLVRDRIERLVDDGAALLELSPLAGRDLYGKDRVPAGGACVACVSASRCCCCTMIHSSTLILSFSFIINTHDRHRHGHRPHLGVRASAVAVAVAVADNTWVLLEV